MRCRFRDDVKKKGRRDEKEGKRMAEGLEKDGEKRRITTPMEKKIERMECGADLSKRQFRNYEKGALWSDLLAGTRSYRVFLLRLRGRTTSTARVGAQPFLDKNRGMGPLYIFYTTSSFLVLL